MHENRKKKKELKDDYDHHHSWRSKTDLCLHVLWVKGGKEKIRAAGCRLSLSLSPQLQQQPATCERTAQQEKEWSRVLEKKGSLEKLLYWRPRIVYLSHLLLRDRFTGRSQTWLSSACMRLCVCVWIQWKRHKCCRDFTWSKSPYFNHL